MTERVAIITGAASGIGRSLAVAYARTGTASVIGTFPGDPHDPQETAALVQQEGGRCVIHEVDVRDSGQVEAFAQRAVDEWGRLDIAVANAGILRRSALAELSDTLWDDMLSVD
ncbi:SDR family NAD(P)-dependent oxidoreductase, partial [Nocardioides allogilvus]|uniref:SDR family NAD(P)-dependent oxidoreductase n=1 Tax=Nocardioides allogilvus TaxID=2072017 RepID=UPI0018E521A0